MPKSLDELIEFLLGEIALSGLSGKYLRDEYAALWLVRKWRRPVVSFQTIRETVDAPHTVYIHPCIPTFMSVAWIMTDCRSIYRAHH